jgi:hypothetical protein
MAKVTIEWTIRMSGRHERDQEDVELTDYVQTLVKAGRIRIVNHHEEPVAPESALDAAPAEPVPAEPELPEPGAEGLVIPMAPPKRRRAKPVITEE